MSCDRTCPPRIQPDCKGRETTEEKENQSAENKSTRKKTTLEKKCTELWHPGFDARFPNQNQTKRCWVNYVDFIRCEEKFGIDHEPCQYFKKTFEHLCPQFWIEEWNDQRATGTFPMPRWA